MKPFTLRSPAKLNLALHVLKKRPDGYHNLSTLFERIDLCDTLTFREMEKDEVRILCDHPDVPLGPGNLIFQVAQRLKIAYKIRSGVEVQLNKRIPVAAGLAGGSSNAATTILGLNRLWRLNLTRKVRQGIARAIGSDVAFFLEDCSWAVGTERGDKIRRVNLQQTLWHLVVVPRLKMYSKKVYGALKLKLTKRNDDVNILIRHLENNDLFALNRFLHNDLEPIIMQFAPGLARLKESMRAWHPLGVMVSGSGPSVFAVTQSESDARKMKAAFARRFKQVFIVRTL